MPDCSKDTIRHVVNFLYTGRIPLEAMNFTEFVKALDILGYPTKSMIYNLPHSQCLFCNQIIPLQFATRHFQDEVEQAMIDIQDKISMNQLVSCMICQNPINYIGTTDKEETIKEHYSIHFNEVYKPNDEGPENNNFDPDAPAAYNFDLQPKTIGSKDFEGDANDDSDDETRPAENSVFSSDEEEPNAEPLAQNLPEKSDSLETNFSTVVQAPECNFDNPIPGPSHENGDTMSPLRLNVPKKTSKKKKRKSEAWSTDPPEPDNKKRKRKPRKPKVYKRGKCNICTVSLNLSETQKLQHLTGHVTVPEEIEPQLIPGSKKDTKCYLGCQLKSTLFTKVKEHTVKEHWFQGSLAYLNKKLSTPERIVNFATMEDVFRELTEEEKLLDEEIRNINNSHQP